MKKFFVVALAAIAMVACTNDEVISIKGGDAIAFADAFVDNATRAAVDPSTTTASIEGFNVWGFMDNTTAPVFGGDKVTKVNGAWTYTNTQYWFPSHTYYFAALAPMKQEGVVTNWTVDTTGANTYGIGEVEFTNINGTEDLLYAATSVETADDINAQPAAVKFQFNHLLSKVKFTFKNGFGTDAGTMVVKDIKMTAPAKATIDLAQADWWTNNEWELDSNVEDVTLAFGNVEALAFGTTAECADERLTIPAAATQVYKVTFTVEVYVGKELAQTFQEETEITNVALEMGKAYNFVAELNPSNLGLFPITFDVEVKEWALQDDVVIVDNLNDILSNGGSVTLTEDLDIVKMQGSNGYGATGLTMKKGAVLDGDNYSLSVPAANTTWDSAISINEGTIKNLTIDAGFRGVFVTSGGKNPVILDNVVINGPVYTISCDSASGNGLKAYNSTFNGWTSYAAAIGTAYFENCSFGEGAGYAFARPYAPTIFVNCKFEAGFKIDARAKIVFADCTLDGVAITADNLATLVAYNSANATVATAAATAAELAEKLALNEAKTIVLTADKYEGAYKMTANTTLWGINNAEVGSIHLNGAENVTLKNLTFDAANSKMAYDGNGAQRCYANIYTGDNTNTPLYGAYNLVIDGCNFTGTFANGGAPIAFADRNRKSGASGNITIKNCNFATENAYYDIYGYYCGRNGSFVIENNTFASNLQGKPIYLGKYQSSTPVEVKGNFFKNYANFSEVASIQAHSGSYTVSFDAADDNTFGK